MDTACPNNTVLIHYYSTKGSKARSGIPPEVLEHLDECLECYARMFPEDISNTEMQNVIENKPNVPTGVEI